MKKPNTLFGSNISLQYGDIIDFQGDAIVNPTDADLTMVGEPSSTIWEHIKDDYSGVTKEERIDDLKNKLQPDLKVTKVFVTGAGNLQVQYIFHAILPPIRTRRNLGAVAAQIYETTQNIMQKAREKNISSIALPPFADGLEEHVTTGIGNFLQTYTMPMNVAIIVPEGHKITYRNFRNGLDIQFIRDSVYKSRTKTVEMNQLVNNLQKSSVSDLAELVMLNPMIKNELNFNWDKKQVKVKRDD